MLQDAVLHRILPTTRELNPELPVALEQIIRNALEKDRELRYQSAAEMLADLKSVLKTIEPVAPAAVVATSDDPASPSSDRPSIPFSNSKQPGILGHRSVRAGMSIGGGLLILSSVIGLIWWKYAPPHPQVEIKEQQLTTNSNDNAVTGAAISGDSKYLAFCVNAGLNVKYLKSGEVHDIPQPPELNGAYVFWKIHWFPGSTRFLAASRRWGDFWITWEGSVVGGVLHRVRNDVAA